MALGTPSNVQISNSNSKQLPVYTTEEAMNAKYSLRLLKNKQGKEPDYMENNNY
jgi:hypothetical protein